MVNSILLKIITALASCYALYQKLTFDNSVTLYCHVIVTAVLGGIVDTQQAAQTNAENMMKELVEKVGQLPGKLST